DLVRENEVEILPAITDGEALFALARAVSAEVRNRRLRQLYIPAGLLRLRRGEDWPLLRPREHSWPAELGDGSKLMRSRSGTRPALATGRRSRARCQTRDRVGRHNARSPRTRKRQASHPRRRRRPRPPRG